MTWAYERHDGSMCLVDYAAPGDASCVLLARFVSDDAAERHKAVHDKALLIAREAGRQELS